MIIVISNLIGIYHLFTYLFIWLFLSPVFCVIGKYSALTNATQWVHIASFFSLGFATFPVQSKWPTWQAGNFHRNVSKIKESKSTGESTNSFSLLPGNDLKIDMQCSNMRSIFLSPPNQVPLAGWQEGSSRLLGDRQWHRGVQPALFAGGKQRSLLLPACSAFQLDPSAHSGKFSERFGTLLPSLVGSWLRSQQVRVETEVQREVLVKYKTHWHIYHTPPFLFPPPSLNLLRKIRDRIDTFEWSVAF